MAGNKPAYELQRLTGVQNGDYAQSLQAMNSGDPRFYLPSMFNSEYQRGYADGFFAGMQVAQAQNGANPYQSGIVDDQLGAQNPGSIPINGRTIGDTLPELELVGLAPLLVEAAPAPILDLD